MLCVGQVYQSTFTVYDQDGPPSSAALAITTLADGVTEQHSGPWEWEQSGRDYTTRFDVALGAAGMIRFSWSSTGPGTAPPPEYITVREFRSLISLAEAREHVNFKRTDSDVELTRFMMAATELVESKGGATIRRDVSERVTHGTYELALTQFPLLAVALVGSTWPGGPSWAAAELDWDADAGLVWLRAMIPFWQPPWLVTYTVGRAAPLESHLQACKEQVRHLWETQRGSMAPRVLEGEEVYTTSGGFTFSVPRRVLELIENEITPAI